MDRPVPVVRMGREKTILLGFLGLLAGVFVGVLSLKLLVPRPPTGTGPDIRPEVAVTTAHERVAPPTPSPSGWDFAAAPPLVAEAAGAMAPSADGTAPAVAAPPTEVPVAPPRSSRFTPPEPIAQPAVAEVRVDDSVAPVAWQRPDPPDDSATARERALPVAGGYVVQAGDSWWELADRAYGDGRLYRALFAWNRARDPRVTLAPGTRLDVPPLDRLQAAWPRLASPALPR